MLRRLILLTAVAGVLLAACSDAQEGATTAGAPDEGNSADTAGGELVDPMIVESNGLTSCAEAFTIEALAERGFAFDGTVTAIEAPAATDVPYVVAFDVTHWYHGGDDAIASLKTYDISGTSLVGDLGLAPGDRVLASGDEDFLWGCGFSMPYSPESEALFEAAFA